VSHSDSTIVFTTTVEPKKEEKKEEKPEEAKEEKQGEEPKKEEPKKEEPKKEAPKKAEEKKEQDTKTTQTAPSTPPPDDETILINLTESKRLGYHYYFNFTEQVGVYYLVSGFSAIQPQMLIKTAGEWNAGEVQFLLEQFASLHSATEFEESLLRSDYNLRNRLFYTNPASIQCEPLSGRKQDAEPEEEYERRVVKRSDNFLIPTKVELGKQKGRFELAEGISFLRVGKFFSFKGKAVKEERISYRCSDLPCDHSENISAFWNPKVQPAIETL
jgi:hypothetical protein